MKLAIVICGEYRTFGICRKTMTFLDKENADIYFSTWNTSVIRIPTTRFIKTDIITQCRILKDLGRPATIEIEDENLIHQCRFNTKMLHRWVRGIKLVKDSGVHYDYILLLRPDLFFQNADLVDEDVAKLGEKIGMTWWSPDNDNGLLGDICMLASPETLYRVISDDIITKWTDSSEPNWHLFWDSHVKSVATLSVNPGIGDCMFCRDFVKPGDSYSMVVEKHDAWRDLCIVERLRFNPVYDPLWWTESIIENAKARFANNELYKYINYD